MKYSRYARSLAASLCAALLGGCSTFSARPDPSRFFTLSSVPQLQGKAEDQRPSSGLSIGIGPVSIPGYLDRQEIVTRVAQNQISLSEYDRWAEPLEESLTRVVSQNVSAMLRAERINAYPWRTDKKPLYQVEIEVLRFEANTAQEAQLAARWAVRNTGQKDSIRYHETRLMRSIPARTTEAAVAALSEALAGLSREIAEAIQGVAGKGK
jgi:uncharacterized lipoprotein YmbA